MGGFWIDSTVPLIPDDENGKLEKKGIPSFMIPNVIAHMRGEDYFPQSSRSWGEKTLLTVEDMLLRKFTYYWDMSGKVAYYMDEYDMKEKTKISYTITPTEPEPLSERDLYYIVKVMGKDRAEREFGLRQIEDKGRILYTFTPEMFPCMRQDFVIKNNVLIKYLGTGGEIVFPPEVTSISPYAFDTCEKYTRIIVTDGMTAINDMAFARCHSLAEIMIPNTVTTIGTNAFSGCSRLTKVTLPKSVTSIGPGAFDGCYHLEEINIPDGVTRIENNTFSGCWELKKISIPPSVTYIAESAFHGCEMLDDSVIPERIKNEWNKTYNEINPDDSDALPF